MLTINQKAMKTRKIILSIAGLALSTLCFGQALSQNSSDILLYSARYNASGDRYEHRVHSFTERTTSSDQTDAPVLSRTYYLPVESDMLLEPWMTSPFENSVSEAELEVESWMMKPFENSVANSKLFIEEENYSNSEDRLLEENPVLENWMIAPF